ncbi:SDR family oxidoreductase [Aquibium sp. A9E412]|uniref:SDR family oxidoreductase n=1 Tax=Aquibium sp. A9E412 TaxID=2976767 RepID=UPI0025B13B6C|nr:SDR family oxidoreductase [Aquibium sp. A9E412]MDN2567277.1 SDR family oxidoreductase [Aquibium sp. A9E412]
MDRAKTAIVTGAGSGIGRATALALAQAGWNTVLAGRRRETLEAVAAQAAGAPGATRAVVCDVTRAEEVDALFAAAVAAFGRLDLLFNNAGTSAPAVPIDALSLDDWRRVLATNVDGAFLCARAAFRQMRAQTPQGGRIVNNGSIAAYAPRPLSAPYTVTKHAITGLTRSLALDGRPYGIACGQIDIGNAASAMTERMPDGVPQADGSVRPEPVMDAGHAARAVLHMASLPPEANVLFMTVMATAMPYVGRG